MPVTNFRPAGGVYAGGLSLRICLGARTRGGFVNKLTIGASEILAHMRKSAKLHRGFADKIEHRFTDGLSLGVPMQTRQLDRRTSYRFGERCTVRFLSAGMSGILRLRCCRGSPLNPSEECCERSIKHSNSASLNSRAPSSGGLSAPLGLIVADCEF
jgi:hypothetical protein